MSAKVCNPMAMSELRTLATVRKPLSSSISVARVKRDLFGPVDKQESKNFIDRELAAHTEALSKKWGFDFGAGQPLKNHEKYQWERVPPTLVPTCFTAMMTISREAHVMPPSSTASEDLLDQRAERENGNVYQRSIMGLPASVSGSDSESDCSFDTVRTYPLVLRSETSALTATAAVTTSTTTATSSNSSSSFPASANRAKRQQRITDYLKERKRLSTSSPKSSVAKKARHMLASSSSATASSMTSSAAAAQQDHQ
ncbi:uncharacterized protein dap [Ochlerotatus camptorhynchus]|uniref:uncharacterized protein dap n=1 Tax=Ochlerotatus camptorhynchus TaxID=644619 RepID=UPI0031CF9AE7